MNRDRKFSQSLNNPPGYHNQMDLGGASNLSPQHAAPSRPGLNSPPGYHDPIDMRGASNSTPQHAAPSRPTRHDENQQRDPQPRRPESSAQSTESNPIYSISNSVIQKVKNCWMELGRKTCSSYRDTSLDRDGASNETPQYSSSVRRESMKIGKAMSLDECDKENNAIWSERLDDYNFLSGAVPPAEKRYTSIFSRQKSGNTQNRRHSITEWRIWPKNNNEGLKCAACQQVVHKSCISTVDTCHGGCAAPAAPVNNNRGGPQVIPDSRFAPAIPQPTQDLSINNTYWNLQLSEYPWWVETMTRIDSTSLLIPNTEGTFLVRWSDNHHQPILSIKTEGEVKHMRINRREEIGYYLSEAHFFSSIVDLINYHCSTPLSESFQGLEQKLTRAVYDTGLVCFTYSAPANSQTHLSMLNGERVVVISNDGEARGWWKGRIGTRVGYFPREYVTLDNEPFM